MSVLKYASIIVGGCLNLILLMNLMYSVSSLHLVCAEIKSRSIPHPDLLIDLSLEEDQTCFLGHLARQLDTGLMVMDETDCRPIPVTSDSAFFKSIEIPAIRFPEQARISALTTFAQVLFSANKGETVLFLNKDLGLHAMLPTPLALQMSGRMIVNLHGALDPTRMERIFMAMTLTARVEAFVFHLNQEVMTTLLGSDQFLLTQDYQLSKNMLTFDTHVDRTSCDVMCYAEDGVISYCGLQHSSLEYFCVKLDTAGANLTSLDKIQNELADLWTSMNTNQLDVVYSYDAIKTALRVVNSLVVSGRWGNRTALDKSGLTACERPLQNLTPETRFYMFAEAITRLPSIPGASGLIEFKGKFVNQKSNFRLLLCQTNSEDRFAVCTNQNSLFSYSNFNVTYSPTLPLKMRLMELRVRVIPEIPFVIKNASGWTGYSIELFEMIAKQLQLKFTYTEQKDGLYGSKQLDGRWDGMIGQVAYREADIAIGRLLINSEGEKLLDYTKSTLKSSGIVLLMATEGDVATTIGFFDEIFSVLLLWMMQKLSPYRDGSGDANPSSSTGLSLLDSMWYGFSPVFLEGEPYDPRPFSVRLLILGYWLFILLVMAMYAANLEAKMQLKSLRAQIDSVEELLAQTEVPYTLRRSSDEYEFFRRMANVEESMFKMWRQNSLSNPVRELTRQTGGRSFDSSIEHFQAEGKLDDLERKWWPVTPPECPEVGSEETLPQMLNLFTFFAVGATLSVLIALVERTVFGITEVSHVLRSESRWMSSNFIKRFILVVESFMIPRRRRSDNRPNSVEEQADTGCAHPTHTVNSTFAH
ncbi:unnamed protein product [Calicophoron daubneyi]|uniref:Uncharacterized protein n=1 Tax=Calicophoron daubneyi TaxID=300641 RepID=A0AAV2TXA7_CALDB